MPHPVLSLHAWAHAHETLLWASKGRGARHTFNYDFVNSPNHRYLRLPSLGYGGCGRPCVPLVAPVLGPVEPFRLLGPLLTHVLGQVLAPDPTALLGHLVPHRFVPMEEGDLQAVRQLVMVLPVRGWQQGGRWKAPCPVLRQQKEAAQRRRDY